MGNLSINKKVAEENNFKPLPEGRYTLIVAEAVEGPTKSNPNNRSVATTIEVLDGPFIGRKLFENYNTVNDNETAWKIGHAELYRLSLAVGLLRPAEDTAEIVNIPFQADIVVKERADTGDLQNKIKAYFTQKGENVNEIRKRLKGPAGTSSSKSDSDATTTAAVPAAAAGGTPPWLAGQL